MLENWAFSKFKFYSDFISNRVLLVIGCDRFLNSVGATAITLHLNNLSNLIAANKGDMLTCYGSWVYDYISNHDTGSDERWMTYTRVRWVVVVVLAGHTYIYMNKSSLKLFGDYSEERLLLGLLHERSCDKKKHSFGTVTFVAQAGSVRVPFYDPWFELCPSHHM